MLFLGFIEGFSQSFFRVSLWDIFKASLWFHSCFLWVSFRIYLGFLRVSFGAF